MAQTRRSVVKSNVSPNPNIRNGLICLILTVFVGVTCYLFFIINDTQKTPFVDEVFHIPQAQKYCKGLFGEWDPKITTLPGLYLLSVGVLTPLGSLLQTEICGVVALRCTNLVSWVINCFLLHRIQHKLHTKAEQDSVKLLLSSFALATFPVLYFFSFLYYTDVASTSAVLLLYLLHLEHRNWIAAATGLIAVVIRQTNIIWVGFVALNSLAEALKTIAGQQRRRLSLADEKGFKCLKVMWRSVVTVFKDGWTARFKFAVILLHHLWSYALVCIGFVAFVLWNGGLVVGDRVAHQPVLHLTQILYFLLFTAIFCSPYFVDYVFPFISAVVSHKKWTFVSVVLCAVIIHFTTLVHPYLLADNRHYAFYVWKRVYERHWLVGYLLIPVYMFGAFSVWKTLKTTHIVFQLAYAVSVVTCLVPQKLFEFRYFIVPYILLRVQIPPTRWRPLLAELFLYSLINAFTIHTFLSKTFLWSDSQELQRIIW